MADSRTKKTKERVERPVRVPIHRARDILAAELPEDKVGRWVKDEGKRLEIFLKAGYEFVTESGDFVGEKQVDSGTQAGGVVSRIGNKDGSLLYLMAIDKKFYDEDQAAKMEKVDKTEEAMHDKSKLPGFYGEGFGGIMK